MRFATLAAGILTLVIAAPALATDYTIDPNHSDVGFKIRHLGVSNVRGSFTDVSGTVSYDEAHPENTTINVVIKTASVDTGNEARDKHLSNPDFFEVEKYPEMTFVSTRVENVEGNTMDVIGNLTIHGVTKEVTLHVSDITPEVTIEKYNMIKRGATGTTTIDRADFWDLPFGLSEASLGDTVQVTIEVELDKVVPAIPGV